MGTRLHRHRRPTAQVPGVLGPSAGPPGGGHDGHPPVRRRVRRLVRRDRPGGRGARANAAAGAVSGSKGAPIPRPPLMVPPLPQSGSGGASGPAGGSGSGAGDPAALAVVVTVAGRSGALPGAGWRISSRSPRSPITAEARATGGRPLPSLPEGRGRAVPGLGRPRPRPGRHRIRRHGGPDRHAEAGADASGTPLTASSLTWARRSLTWVPP